MYEYIKGRISELNPSYAIVENNGLGWFLNISVNTYSKLKEGQECLLFLHHVVREDDELLYAFESKSEREIFRLLISVNGVGANTARTMLSTLTADDIIHAIQTDNVGQLKSIKGIGLKTAQRIIVDLRDKITEKSAIPDDKSLASDNTNEKEAFEALVMLGFSKKQVQKAMDKVVAKEPNASVEELVKLTLKQL
jgi:Holliday junction DNA helicase RuvA